MIDVIKTMKSVCDAVNYVIGTEVYCICYDDKTDKRILINYGIFMTREDCFERILSIKNNKNLKVYPIKMNGNERIEKELNFLKDKLEYCNTLEWEVAKEILIDIDDSYDKGLKDADILDFISGKYGLTTKEIQGLLPIPQIQNLFKCD